MSSRWLSILLISIRWLPVLLVGLLAGCSARDPVTQTPVYHVGTPTNRSSVNSWELLGPVPQSGVYHGKPADLKPIASQRGFEPDDPLAEAVLNALNDDGISTQYLSARAKNGVVILAGSVTTAAQKSRAGLLARAVPGVTRLDSRVAVIKP